ncbi:MULTISPECIES: DHH family phosphoesterase [unclassified Exiguobacterium]|uniref:DHH family phosphoesterase n=1 Tax=unclassified Exiguobacterium TaxID=2644629 RepID=UPI001BEA7547
MTDLFSFRKPVPSIVIDERLLQRAEKVVLFDYHRRDVEFIDNTLLVYLEPYASSTAELVTELIEYQPKHDKILIPCFSIISLVVNSQLSLSLTTAHFTSLHFTSLHLNIRFCPRKNTSDASTFLKWTTAKVFLYCLKNLG